MGILDSFKKKAKDKFQRAGISAKIGAEQAYNNAKERSMHAVEDYTKKLGEGVQSKEKRSSVGKNFQGFLRGKQLGPKY